MCAAVLAFLLLATTSQGTSQGPPPTPAKAAQDQQNHGQSEPGKPSPNEKNTEPSALPIEEPKAEVAIWNQTERSAQGDGATSQHHQVEVWPEATAIAVAVATIALAALAVWQSHLMRKGLGETRKANETTERALVLTQRAYLIAQNFALVRLPDESPTDSVIGRFGIRFEVANVGSTIAAVTEAITCVVSGPLPEIPDYSCTDRGGLATPTAIAPRDTVTITVSLEGSEGLIAAMSPLSLFIFGKMQYLDVFDDTHKLRYARKMKGINETPSRVAIAGYEEST